jgi:hypothetical protein
MTVICDIWTLTEMRSKVQTEAPGTERRYLQLVRRKRRTSMWRGSLTRPAVCSSVGWIPTPQLYLRKGTLFLPRHSGNTTFIDVKHPASVTNFLKAHRTSRKYDRKALIWLLYSPHVVQNYYTYELHTVWTYRKEKSNSLALTYVQKLKNRNYIHFFYFSRVECS